MNISLLGLIIKNNLNYLKHFDNDLRQRNQNNIALLNAFRKGDMEQFKILAQKPLNFDIKYEPAGNLFSIIGNYSQLFGRDFETKGRVELKTSSDDEYNCLMELLKNSQSFQNENFQVKIHNFNRNSVTDSDLLMLFLGRFRTLKCELEKAFDLLFNKGFIPQKSPYIAKLSRIIGQHSLAQFGDDYLHAIECMAKNGCDVNLKEENNRDGMTPSTPLTLAILYNNLKLTQLLIKLGVSYDIEEMRKILLSMNVEKNECLDYVELFTQASKEKQMVEQSVSQALSDSGIDETGMNALSESKSKFKI